MRLCPLIMATGTELRHSNHLGFALPDCWVVVMSTMRQFTHTSARVFTTIVIGTDPDCFSQRNYEGD